MSQSQETTSPRVWSIRLVGLVLLGYTFFMTFTVPLGPGIEDVRVNRTELTEDGAVYEVEILGHGTHFTTSEPRVFASRRRREVSHRHQSRERRIVEVPDSAAQVCARRQF